MTPTGQDGKGLVSEEMAEQAWDAWHEAHDPPNAQMRAALAAVAPDIAAQARRECAEELSRYAAAIGRSNVYDDPQLAQIERALNGIVAEWSGSGSTPASG